MDVAKVIAGTVSNVARDFLSLANALSGEEHFAAQVSPMAVRDEFTRFKMWAGNIAAHRRGRRSLEYRLRDAEHLKIEVQNLLSDLAEALHKGTAIVKGERVPWDAEEFSDSDSESEVSDLGSTVEVKTELKQLLESIKTIVTSLFRLSMAIRDPAPNSQSKSTITVDKSIYQQHDILHVQAKYPTCAEFLTERMGRAISARRQYLNYREEHHNKLMKNIEKIGLEDSRTEHTTNSTEATPMPGISRQNSLNVLDEDDSASQTSFATSINAAMRIPPLPKEARSKDFFECPLCFMIISVHTKSGWKQHVYRDLHPYCCTFEDCAMADRLYDSRHEWFRHELEAHRRCWECIEDCGKTFDTLSSFEHHLKGSHFDMIDMLAAIKKTSARGATLSTQVACAFCQKAMSLKVLQKHLGYHQQQLALFALPSCLDETEDDEDNDDAENAETTIHDDSDELSDVSDAELPQDNDGSNQSTSEDKEGEFEDLKKVSDIEDRLYNVEERFSDMKIKYTRFSRRPFGHQFDEQVKAEIRKLLQDLDRSIIAEVRTIEAMPGASLQLDMLNEARHIYSQALQMRHDLDSVIEGGTQRNLGGEASFSSLFNNISSSIQNEDVARSDQNDAMQAEGEQAKHGGDEGSLKKHAQGDIEAHATGSTAHTTGEDLLETYQNQSRNAHDRDAVAFNSMPGTSSVEHGENHGGKSGPVQRAIDEYNQKKAQVEAEAKEERDRLIYEFERKKFQNPGESEKEREELIMKLKVNEEKRKIEETEYEEFLRKQKAEEEAREQTIHDNEQNVAKAEALVEEEQRKRVDGYNQKKAQLLEEAKKQLAMKLDINKGEPTETGEAEYEESLHDQISDDKETEKAMLDRLVKFGFDVDQIERLTHPEEQKESQQGLPPHNPLRIAHHPTYAKISRAYLDIETLQYYDLPYEEDGNYLIILRQMTERETEVLFEHTRRLRRRVIQRNIPPSKKVESAPPTWEEQEHEQPYSLPKVEAYHSDRSDEDRYAQHLAQEYASRFERGPRQATRLMEKQRAHDSDIAKPLNASTDAEISSSAPIPLEDDSDDRESRRIQGSGKEFRCMYCPRSFALASTLRSHLRTHHAPRDEDFSYITSADLDKHKTESAPKDSVIASDRRTRPRTPPSILRDQATQSTASGRQSHRRLVRSLSQGNASRLNIQESGPADKDGMMSSSRAEVANVASEGNNVDTQDTREPYHDGPSDQ